VVTLTQTLPAAGQRSTVLTGFGPVGAAAAAIGLHGLFGIELGETFLDLLDPLGEELARGFGIVGIGAGRHVAIAAHAALLEPLAQTRPAPGPAAFAAAQTTAQTTAKPAAQTAAPQAATALTTQTAQAAAGATLAAAKTATQTAPQATATLAAQAPQAAAGAALTTAQTATKAAAKATAALAAQAATQPAAQTATLAQTATEAATETCAGTGTTGAGPGSATRTAALSALTFERALIFRIVVVVVGHPIRSLEIRFRGPGATPPVHS